MPAKAPGNGRGRKPASEEPPRWIGFEGPGDYADIVRVASAERHFLLTFAQARPDRKDFQVVDQIYLNPRTAAELMVILANHIIQYEMNNETKITPEGFSYNFGPEGEDEDDPSDG